MKKQLIAACALFLVIGTAGAQIVVRIGPPRPPREVIPARPPEHRGWVWVGGFHRWDGHAYVWVPGHWAHRRGGYVWIEGRWR